MHRRRQLALLGTTLRRSAFLVLAVAAVMFTGGTMTACQQLLGLDGFQDFCKPYGVGDPPDCVPHGGGGNETVCTPDATRPCYDGKDGTAGIGPCKLGVQTCDVSGMAWGKCLGEIVPKATDDCTVDNDDSNCSGKHDCVCKPGDQQQCYSGDPMTKGVGACRAGTQVCAKDGQSFGPCNGEVIPTAMDDCNSNPQRDTTCDGKLACMCTPGDVQSCYDGTKGTEGTLPCKPGTHQCDPDGKAWGACVGEVTDKPEDCSTAEDDDCNGTPLDQAAGCVCLPADVQPCYTGDPATRSVGVCKDGSWTCDPSGKAWGQCMNEMLPAPADDCSNALDEDCSGSYCTQCLWSADYGDGSGQTLLGIVADANANAYAFGNFAGTLPVTNPPFVGSGAFDAFVVKFDAKGKYVWGKQLSGMSIWIANVAIDTQGNVVVAGTFSGSTSFDGGLTFVQSHGQDGFIVKYDSQGNLLWAKALSDYAGGSASQGVGDVAVDAIDNIVVVGTASGSIDFGTGQLAAKGQDAFVAKIQPNGMVSWVDLWGDAAAQSANAVAVDSSGAISFAGTFSGSMGPAGNPIIASGIGNDVFLVKLAPAGSWFFGRGYGGGAGDDRQPSRMRIDSQGNIVLIGQFMGTLDFGGGHKLTNVTSGVAGFVLKVTNATGYLWSTQIGNSSPATGSDIIPSDVTIDAKDNIYVGGSCDTDIDVGLSLSCSLAGFVAKFDSGGSPQWARSYGQSANVGSLAWSPPSLLFVAGGNGNQVDIGCGNLVAKGLEGVWVGAIASE